MFNSSILDVLIGLVFVFLVVSLVASALTEALSSVVNLRSRTLLSGVKALLNDPNGIGLAKDLYNHALISPRDTGEKASTDDMTSTPAYIDPTQFANAMIELNGLAGKTPDEMKNAVAASQLSPQTKQLLVGMVDRAQYDADKLRSELSSWFDGAMDRVSGVYKRLTQLVGFVIALAVAVALNIDTINVARVLWVQPMLTKSIDGQKFADAGDAVAKLSQLQLPIGWSGAAPPAPGVGPIGLSIVIGWLITAVASLFGAPFWYDALQTFVRVKGAGPSPAEKKSGAGAAA